MSEFLNANLEYYVMILMLLNFIALGGYEFYLESFEKYQLYLKSFEKDKNNQILNFLNKFFKFLGTSFFWFSLVCIASIFIIGLHRVPFLSKQDQFDIIKASHLFVFIVFFSLLVRFIIVKYRKEKKKEESNLKNEWQSLEKDLIFAEGRLLEKTYKVNYKSEIESYIKETRNQQSLLSKKIIGFKLKIIDEKTNKITKIKKKIKEKKDGKKSEEIRQKIEELHKEINEINEEIKLLENKIEAPKKDEYKEKQQLEQLEQLKREVEKRMDNLETKKLNKEDKEYIKNENSSNLDKISSIIKELEKTNILLPKEIEQEKTQYNELREKMWNILFKDTPFKHKE